MLESRREISSWPLRTIPVSETKHQFISLKIASALLLYAESGNLGHVLQAPCDVIFAREFVVQPDILFVEKGRSGLIGEKHFWGVPDVIIEIVSQDTRENDLKIKRSIYSRFGVKEYWIVDLHFETVEVLAWSELGYATAGVYGKSNCLSSPALPGFTLSLRRVFHKQF
jgi:Uma2 family endonuclease